MFLGLFRQCYLAWYSGQTAYRVFKITLQCAIRMLFQEQWLVSSLFSLYVKNTFKQQQRTILMMRGNYLHKKWLNNMLENIVSPYDFYNVGQQAAPTSYKCVVDSGPIILCLKSQYNIFCPDWCTCFAASSASSTGTGVQDRAIYPDCKTTCINR